MEKNTALSDLNQSLPASSMAVASFTLKCNSSSYTNNSWKQFLGFLWRYILPRFALSPFWRNNRKLWRLKWIKGFAIKFSSTVCTCKLWVENGNTIWTSLSSVKLCWIKPNPCNSTCAIVECLLRYKRNLASWRHWFTYPVSSPVWVPSLGTVHKCV